MDLEEKLKEIIYRVLEDETLQIDFNLNLHDYHEIDSIQLVSILIEIEKSLSVKVPPRKAREMNTFQDLLTFIKSKKMS